MFRRRLPKLVKESVVLHTRDGRSLSGVLSGAYPDVVALAHASYFLEDGRREPLSGDLLVPRENVSFLHREGP